MTRIRDVFSKRNLKLNDVYIYDSFPEKLKNQVYHIWNDFLSQEVSVRANSLKQFLWEDVYSTILREEGKKSLLSSEETFSSRQKVVETYFEIEKSVKKSLDIVELIFECMSVFEEACLKKSNVQYPFSDAIKDLNHRFRENGIGYQYENNLIVRIDNQLMHKEVIKPSLNFLSEEKFKNANEEYLSAFNHYRSCRFGESLNECLKSFESTLKIICNNKGWEIEETDTARKLIRTVLQNGLIPSYFESELQALRQLLESSIPTIRNKNSGHGQGSTKIKIPEHLVSYMLCMTGATIKFLIESNERINN